MKEAANDIYFGFLFLFLEYQQLAKKGLAAASPVLSALLLLIFLCYFFFPAESQILAEVDRMLCFLL